MVEFDEFSLGLIYCLGLPNGRGGWTPLRPLRGLQETRVATREESGVLGFPSSASNSAMNMVTMGKG